MTDKSKNTVQLAFQGACDGSVEAFEVNGMMAVPSEEGTAYVSWDNVLRFFPQAREKDYPIPTHYVVVDEHDDIRYSCPINDRHPPYRGAVQAICMEWIKDARDNNEPYADSLKLRSAGVFSSTQDAGLSESAARLAASILRDALPQKGHHASAQLQSVIKHLMGEKVDCGIEVDGAPEGATHYQPNDAPNIAGLFWQLENDYWVYWYGGRWCPIDNQVTPPGLLILR